MVGQRQRMVTMLLLGVGWLCVVGYGKRREPSEAALVRRGRYLVTICGCNDCHTPLKMGRHGPEPDQSRLLSGHPETMPMPLPPESRSQTAWQWHGASTNTAFAGPWGISYAANLTPDKETGIGNWTVKEFMQAMRTGHSVRFGRPLLPPMPWQNYAKMTDADLRAIFAYLKSLKPIRNHVPPSVPMKRTSPPTTKVPANR
jgi:hypothetical protein